MAYPRFRQSRAHKLVTKTDGSLTATMSYVLIAGTAIPLRAGAGDRIIVGVSGLWDNQAPNGMLMASTVIAGAVVNDFLSGQDNGLLCWFGAGSVFSGISGNSPPYSVVAGDLSNGIVTVQLKFRASAAGKVLRATAVDTLVVWAENLGPPAS